MLIGPQDDVAAFAPVAAVRPAARHKFLASKANAAAPAIARLRHDFDPVNKHRETIHRLAHNDSP